MTPEVEKEELSILTMDELLKRLDEARDLVVSRKNARDHAEQVLQNAIRKFNDLAAAVDVRHYHLRSNAPAGTNWGTK